MNRIKSSLLASLALVVLLSFVSVCRLNAQVPPPPPNGGQNSGHGLGGNQPANTTAPLGNGVIILLVLGSAYASRKVVSGDKNEE